MSGSGIEVIGTSTTPRMGRRSMALSDIDPKYVSQSGIWEASEVETSRGSIRIQHITSANSAVSASTAGSRISSSSMTSATGSGGVLHPVEGQSSNPRFPKLEECAHFHYDCVELPQIKVQIRDDPSKPICLSGDESQDHCVFALEVVAGGQSWIVRRTHNNIHMLDSQLHRCVWDRSFSLLQQVHQESLSQHQQDGCRESVTKYLSRLNELPTNKITCGTVLSWFELDNRGRHIVSADDSAINTPAVAAAYAEKKYVAQAADEISFDVGAMISVIDMPPPEESIWWRGKRGFHVGFFPRDCVKVIGDKVPAGLPIMSSVGKLQRLSVSSTSTSSSSSAPDKPVLRKHGKLIAFFRSFILSRPSRRRLKQSGILRERVFSCDLAEHLQNTGHEIPTVLQCCAEFIEKHGIVDGVYRLSGITSNIQKLRNAFDEDKIPNLEGDLAIKQDIHAVSSLLKMYFRELPNPLCTYQLYEKFVAAAKESDTDRLLKMREVVHELPPPHYRTLQYLMKHLSRVAQRNADTGMTAKNMAIVWAPNLIRCRELEAGGVAALKGIGVQAVVTEYLIRHADLIFNDKLPANFPSTTTVLTQKASSSGNRPKSLAISSPIKLMSLEEAQDKAKDDRKYIDVGGGPSSLPPKYHTVIDLPSRRGLKSKRSPIGWKHFFSRNRSFSKSQRKQFTPGDITVITRNMPVAGPQGMQTNWAGRLRPVKSVESLISSPSYPATDDTQNQRDSSDAQDIIQEAESCLSRSSPATPVTTDVHIMFHPPPSSIDARSLQGSKTHNRSISHDSYFEFGEFRNGNNVYIDETLEEETMSQSSKLSMDLSGSELESNVTSPVRTGRSKSEERDLSPRRDPFGSPKTPPPSVASVRLPSSDSYENALACASTVHKRSTASLSTQKLPEKISVKWRDSEVQTSHLKLYDVGVSTDEQLCGSQTGATMTHAGRPKSVEIQCSVISTASAEREKEKYDLDNNSSLDESSELSTPEEPFPSRSSTNIIYSPLVNEISNTSSAELLPYDRSSMSSTSTHKQSLKSNRSSKSMDSEPIVQSASSENVCVFVCPLYEAGILPEDFAEKSCGTSASTAKADNTMDTSKEDHSVAQTSPAVEHQYMNCSPVLPNAEKEASLGPSQAELVVPQTKEICHIYENDRVYENQPVAPVRRKSPISHTTRHGDYEQSSGKRTSNDPTIISEPDLPVPKPKAREPLPSTCIDVNSVYSPKSEEHYENIGEDGNIYEDIDSEGEKHQQGNRENQYSGSSSCRYELVGDGSSMPPPKVTPRQSQPKEKPTPQIESSDDEYSSNYESVHFQKVDNKLVPHHYSEIEDKTPTPEEDNSKSEVANMSISSSSNSRTDESNKYLEHQTPSFKVRNDSLEDHKSEDLSSYESVGIKHSETIDEVRSPDDDIHFIDDSPLAVENPVYSLEIEGIDPGDIVGSESKKTMEEEDGDFDVSMNESVSISMNFSIDEDKIATKTENLTPGAKGSSSPGKQLQPLGRCNSAPLTETKQDFTLASTCRDQQRPGSSCPRGNENNEEDSKHANKQPLNKRLSEPSLMSFTAAAASSKLDIDNAATAWKLADAKRLANRKQSVKELLSKFESRDSTPSPTNSNSLGTISPLGSLKDTPGLPKPLTQQGFKAPLVGRCKSMEGNNNGRFPHHRLSMGDILLGQTGEEDSETARSMSPSNNFMTRSDTFPELRSGALKVPQGSKENLDFSGKESKSQGNLNEDLNALVPDKTQNALRVAMSSVDMNDPSTRERIEKYKEERRSFLRQKITSEIQHNSSSDDNSSPPSSMDKDSQMTNRLNANTESSNAVPRTVGNSNFLRNSAPPPSNNNKSQAESPRKRAFSEDISSSLPNNYPTHVKTKSIKTEPEFFHLSEETSFKTTTTQEEINVKEKIALWTSHKKELSKSTLSCQEISSKCGDSQKSFPRPTLRREVTTSSIEISKCKLVSKNEGSGTKIKDIAAFFEGKKL